MEYNDDFIERYLQDEVNEVETAKFLIDLRDNPLLREKVRNLCVLIKGIKVKHTYLQSLLVKINKLNS